MSVLFIRSSDIKDTYVHTTHIERPRRTNGDNDLVWQALSEINDIIHASHLRWTNAELYYRSAAAQRRWPNGVAQGAKAIERNLTTHGYSLGIVKTPSSMWRAA